IENSFIIYLDGFFFFQAEVGIRDFRVTGVQTCALPIYSLQGVVLALDRDENLTGSYEGVDGEQPEAGRAVDEHIVDWVALGFPRSEERRVGKEWRSRWLSMHE